MTYYVQIMIRSILIIILTILTNNIFCKERIYQLRYKTQVPNNAAKFEKNYSDRPTDTNWENSTLPIGNGYMGASIWGRTDTERIMISDKTLHIKGLWGSETNTSFVNLYFDFFHYNVDNYERTLTLNNGIHTVKYKHKGVTYKRTYFANYPDKVIIFKFTANKKNSISFNLKADIPYLVPFGKLNRRDSITIGYLSGPTQTRFSNNGRIGKVYTEGGNILSIRGKTEYLNMIYEGMVKVINYGGNIKQCKTNSNDYLCIEKADSAFIIFTLDTNYELSSEIFTLPPSKKLNKTADPHKKVSKTIENASRLGYEKLYNNHTKDFSSFFNRVKIDLGKEITDKTTDELIACYKKGETCNYLEEILFQYGRYLLISSSRKGSLPPLLQGVWNQYELAPWNNNYTHNINIQMNYWPVFNTNLTELFEPYVDYYKAYREKAEKVASNYIKKYHRKNYSNIKGENGWIVGSATGPFFIGSPGGHSGPGTGGLTAKLFSDYYYFTKDDSILQEITYPAISGVAKFFHKTLIDTLGYKLAYPSSSPEQFNKYTNKPYKSMGCAFDQEMIYETFKDLLITSEILGINNNFIRDINNTINYLNPINIGKSGQIKEYREEVLYDDIVLEKNHRHISNLIGLYPGTLINNNEQWIKASKVTLKLRGDISTGWSMAHKINLWARTFDGEHTHLILEKLIKNAVFDNLWTNCTSVLRSPFQIDANLGTTAGIAEMLLQSHSGYIDILPALPKKWHTGCYEGLIARGNFVVSVSWKKGKIENLKIISRKGGECKIKLLGKYKIKDNNNNLIMNTNKNNIISFPTKENETYYLYSVLP